MKKRVVKRQFKKHKKDLPKEIVVALLIIVIIVYVIGTWTLISSFSNLSARTTPKPTAETQQEEPIGQTTDNEYANIKITILEQPS